MLDADDTTLWTYDMEVAAMHFVFDPAVQDVWVQPQKFPATPGMVVAGQRRRGGRVHMVGLTGRNDNQKAATLGNLAKVGYTGFTAANYYTKWVSGVDAARPTSPAPRQTRVHARSSTSRRPAGTWSATSGYDIVANFGDQYSDLIGGSADRVGQAAEPDVLPALRRPGSGARDISTPLPPSALNCLPRRSARPHGTST